MKKLFIIAILLSTAFCSFAQACNSKAKLVGTIHAIVEKPSVFVSNKYLYIIHPMLKKEDREREFKSKGDLKWKGDSCKITYTSYEQTKGHISKSTIKLGETFQFNYPLNALKTFLVDNELKGWEFSENLELDKQQFSGYRSIVEVAGVEKDFKVYLRDSQLYAISCGFSKEGLSHENEMNESADFWYFEKVKGNLRLVKKFTMEASKSNSIPYLTKTTDNYHYKKLK